MKKTSSGVNWKEFKFLTGHGKHGFNMKRPKCYQWWSLVLLRRALRDQSHYENYIMEAEACQNHPTKGE